MSDEQLIVTIGAKDSASTVIKKVNQELKYLDKEYKLTEQSSKDFDRSMDGLQAKLSTLERKYEANNIKLQAYKKQLDTAREGISKKEEELQKLTNSEGDNSAAIEKAEKQLSRYKDQMANATRNINLTELEMKNLNEEIRNTSNSINSFKIDQFKLKMDEIASTLKTNGEKIKAFGEGTSKFGGSLMKLSAPVVGLAVASTKAAVDFETAFTGVMKTVDGTKEQFEALEKGIKDMSTRMPPSASKIAEVAEAAGQLGIKTDAILGFTETMVKLGDSTNMSSDEAATALARLANITQMPQDQFDKLGSVIVHLGNNLATTESEIVAMGLRLAGAGKQIGLTEAQTLGLAGAFSSVGIEAEMGGSAISKVMVKMQASATIGSEQAKKLTEATGMSIRELELLASNNGKAFKEVAASLNMTTSEINSIVKSSKELDNFGKIAGMTGEQFKQAFKEDAATALIAFIRGLGNAESAGSSAIEMLEEMGIKEVRLRDSLLRAANAGTLLEDSIKMGTDAWNENAALTTEAGKRYETTASKIEMLKNKANKLGIEIGENLLPYTVDIMEELSDLVQWFGSLDKSTQQTIIKTGMLTFALGGSLKIIGNFTSGIGSIVKVTGKTTEGIGKLAKKFSDFNSSSLDANKGVGILSKGMNLLNPVTLSVGAGIAVVSGAMAVAKTNNELMKKGISYTTDEMGSLEKAVAKFNGTNFKSRKELEESGIIYKEFSKNISPEFQEKIKENTKSINDFSIKLNEINFDGIISEDESNTFVNEVDKACISAINAIKSRQAESNKAMQDMFISDGVIDESEKKVLEFMNKSSETQIAEVNKLKADILAIEQKSLEEKRALTDGEISLIQEKYTRISQIELENLGKSKAEILYATNEFQERIKNIDLEGAKEIVAEKAKIRDEEATKIVAGYDTQIQLMKDTLAKATGEEKKALEEQISIAETRKGELLAKNNELYEGYLTILNEKNPIIMENINKQNGEELSAADIKKQEMLKKLKEQYDGLNNITETGNYIMYDKVNKSYSDVAVTVDEKTGEILGIYDRYTDEMGGYTDEIATSTKKVAAEHNITKITLANALNDMKNNTVNAAGQIVDSNGNVISSLKDFKTNADETREGVLNLNGTPINVKADTNGAISNLEDVNNAVSNIPSRKNVTISTIFEAVGNGIKSLLGFAEGTNYAPIGPAFVAEEGRELIVKNGRAVLTGDSGPQLYNFTGGEKVYTNYETEKILSGLSSGYFNANSYKSQSLIRNNNIVNSYSNSVNNSNNMDIANVVKSLATEITNTLIDGLRQVKLQSGDVYLETGQLVGTISNELAKSTMRRR